VQSGPLTTDADKVLDRYRQVKHTYGERGKGAPNFNAPVENKTPAADKTDAAKQPRNP
jgi:hypothetical protein